MADKKISELTELTTPDGTEELVVNDSGVSKKITQENLFSLADGVKAQFGASNDLQIWHSGSNSFIDEAGTGSLWVRGNNLVLGKYTGEHYLYAYADGAVTLYHNNAVKLATTATGIDVTGSVTADGLTVEGNYATFSRTSGIDVLVGDNTTTSGYIGTNTAHNFYLFSDGSKRLQLDTNGDISFYDDTGTTPKFRWDASAERLGIGTSSPSQDLEILNGTAGAGIRLAATDTAYWDIERSPTTGNLTFTDDAAGTVLTLDQSSGNVGIGTSSPTVALELGSVKAQRWQTGSTTLDLTPTPGGIDQFVFNASQDTLIDFKMGGTTKTSITTNGITFNGDTAAANALDDYEEGTWTPVVYGATTAGSYIYGYQYGKYTKIGNMVHYTLNIYTTGGTAGTGEIRISGLPFTNTGGRNYCMAATQNDHSAATEGVSFYVQPGTTYLRGVHNIDADTAFELRITGTYNIN